MLTSCIQNCKAIHENRPALHTHEISKKYGKYKTKEIIKQK